jgi:hypothetical protein
MEVLQLWRRDLIGCFDAPAHAFGFGSFQVAAIRIGGHRACGRLATCAPMKATLSSPCALHPHRDGLAFGTLAARLPADQEAEPAYHRVTAKLQQIRQNRLLRIGI